MFEGRAASPAAAPLAGALRRDRFAKAFFIYSLHISICTRPISHISHQPQVAVFEGRAALPAAARLVGALRLDRFTKSFFLHPDSEELLGRVDVCQGGLGDTLYPLYFRATIGSSIVPGMLLCFRVDQGPYACMQGAVPAPLPRHHRQQHRARCSGDRHVNMCGMPE